MRERLHDLAKEVKARFKRTTIFISWQDWAKVQSGIFDLNGADMINKNLAQNTVAATYDYEGVTDAALGTLDYGRNALQRINEVLDKSDVADFMETTRSENGSYQLMPKPGYEGRVTMTEIQDDRGFPQAMRIDLKRGF